MSTRRARHHRRRAARGDAALIDLRASSTASIWRRLACASAADEIDAARAQAPAEAVAALRLAPPASAYPRAPAPADLRFTDASRRRTGLALERRRGGRPLCAGRHGQLSVLGADERRAGEGRGRRAHRHGGAHADGKLNPLVLAAARLAGVDEIYRVGGAQAVAALAYGTATIRPVAKIVGPGNAYVAAAKRQVFGTVGIDMIAGPSEVLIMADGSANPDWIAADLLAQAEHDAGRAIHPDHRRRRPRRSAWSARSIASSRPAARAIAAPLARFRRDHPGAGSGRLPGLADRLAAEHLEIMAEDAEALPARCATPARSFIGAHTPEAIGDYVGGSNHVLPTARSARFSSGLACSTS
jgi:histidinol dehydrogenase